MSRNQIKVAEGGKRQYVQRAAVRIGAATAGGAGGFLAGGPLVAAAAPQGLPISAAGGATVGLVTEFSRQKLKRDCKKLMKDGMELHRAGRYDEATILYHVAGRKMHMPPIPHTPFTSSTSSCLRDLNKLHAAVRDDKDRMAQAQLAGEEPPPPRIPTNLEKGGPGGVGVGTWVPHADAPGMTHEVHQDLRGEDRVRWQRIGGAGMQFVPSAPAGGAETEGTGGYGGNEGPAQELQPVEAQTQVIEIEKGPEGYGFVIDDECVVTSVKKGGAAQAAGVRVNSRIVAVFGHPVGAKTDVIAELRKIGRDATRIQLTFQLPDEYVDEYVQVRFDFDPQEAGQISVRRGEYLKVVEPADNGWLLVMKDPRSGGITGHVPVDYTIPLSHLPLSHRGGGRKKSKRKYSKRRKYSKKRKSSKRRKYSKKRKSSKRRKSR
jgi:hypothetical protein